MIKVKKTYITKESKQNKFYPNPINYNPIIQNTSTEVNLTYIKVIINFLGFISSKVNMKDHIHFRFLIEKGLETLHHIFTLTFFYTKNISYTQHHAENAFCYYIEFIEQISDDQITFLQLTSREAVLFAYKKTIYDLHNEYKKSNVVLIPEEQIIFSTIDEYKKINKCILNYTISHNSFNYNNKVEYIKTCGNQLLKFNIQLCNNNFNIGLIECVYILSNKLTNTILSKPLSLFYDILFAFITKLNLKRNVIDLKKIHYKINNNLSSFVNDETFKTLTYIEDIFSDV